MDNLLEYNFFESYLQDFAARRSDLEHTSTMLSIVRSLLVGLPAEERQEILSMQGFLIDKLSDYQPAPIRFPFEPLKSTWQLVRDLLDSGQKRGAESLVALNLVGATLQLRFPDIPIGNESYSTADMQLGRAGDFKVGDTVFHITVSPMSAVYEKCKRNPEQGLKVYLLVPDRLVAGTKQNIELQAAGRIAVQSIEAFISQNFDELSQFSISEAKKAFRQFLEIYNERVDAVETNKSMMIDIPANL
jgi:hypothetical protein